MSFANYKVPYAVAENYSKRIAYFSMEFAVHQPLKIYSGGLGFLSGSHMRSAYELKQNMVGIGILWKYGYYDQDRNKDGTLKPNYIQKDYSFLSNNFYISTTWFQQLLVASQLRGAQFLRSLKHHTRFRVLDQF